MYVRVLLKRNKDRAHWVERWSKTKHKVLAAGPRRVRVENKGTFDPSALQIVD